MHHAPSTILRCAALCLSLTAITKPAYAVAHHRDVVLQKLRGSDGKVNGFRLHALLAPETYNLVRLNVGKMAIDSTVVRGSNDHRLVAAGIKPGYVRAQMSEFNISTMQGGGGMYEVKLDIHYGATNDLKPGEKVDIFSTHSTAGGSTYWHVFGMFDGPVNRGDVGHVHELPSDTSAHGEATATP